MARVTVDVNYKEYLKRLKLYETETTKAVKSVLRSTAIAVESGAKSRAPVNFGQLRSQIRPTYSSSGLKVDVGTHCNYGSFVEYGTGPRAGHDSYRYPPPISALYLWAKRKNVNLFAVRWSIYKHGTWPHPFLFPAYEAELPRFHNRMQVAVKAQKP